MDFIETCRKFIALESTPDHSNKELVLFAADLAQKSGFKVDLQQEHQDGIEQLNIIVRPVEQRPPSEFLLETHLDTPEPGHYGLWNETGNNPFDAHIIDQKIYGLGAADVKLDFLCKLQAMASFKDHKNWKLPPVLVGTYGEESGMQGALKLIRKNKVSAKMAIIGEPSNLQLITAGKGLALVEIRIPFSEEEKNYRIDHNFKESTSTNSRIFSGKAAHSAVPHLGESAIKKMLDYLLSLSDQHAVMEIDGGVNFNTVPNQAFIELDLVRSNQVHQMQNRICTLYRGLLDLEIDFKNFEDMAFYPPHPTLNLGVIRTTEDHIFLSGTCRLPPTVTQEIYEQWMRKIKQICTSIDAEFYITDYKKPYRTDNNSLLVRGCLEQLKELNLEAKTTTQSSTNEACLFSRIGIECVSFGAGMGGGNVHTPQEHVKIDDLQTSISFYTKVIERFCK